jgi:MYXO-CTERM domain-containing protein
VAALAVFVVEDSPTLRDALIAVVGAGLAGLAAAWLLGRRHTSRCSSARHGPASRPPR